MSIGKQDQKVVLDLMKWFEKEPIVVDVGAHKGTWSDIVLGIFFEHCKVYMFEPNGMLLNYLKVKYDYNDNVYFSSKVAYSKSFVAVPFNLFTDKHSELSGIYYNPDWDYLNPKTDKVDAITLDHFLINQLGLDNIDCIKIDVEGADYDVLQGCEKLMKDKKVKFIQIEYSPHYKLNNYKFKDVIEFAQKLEYKVYDHDGEYFKEVIAEDFIEDYTLKNFIITHINISRYNYTEYWNADFIKNVAGLGKFNFALEIGCFQGRTSNYICDNMLMSGGRLVCIDPLADVYLVDNLDERALQMNESLTIFNGQYSRFIHNTKGQPIEFIRKTSKEAFEQIKDYRFDFIYIDGDHREEAVYEDAVMALEVCNSNGVILFDDYDEWEEGTKRGIDKFIEEYQTEFEIIFKGYQLLIRKG